jgi:hypothetical protein
MNTREAQAMLVAIALQESDLNARRQRGGPARSHLQFETGGLIGVLQHPSSTMHAAALVNELDYSDLTPHQLHAAMEFDGVLAAGMGRLLLWTDARSIPSEQDGPDAGWAMYLRNWRPGKPHPERWSACWTTAWSAA